MMAGLRGMLIVAVIFLVTACVSPPPRGTAPAATPPAVAQPPSAAPAAAVSSSGDAPPIGNQAASPSGASAAQPLSSPQKVRVDSIGIAAEAPLFLAIEHGYFQELGLELELIPLTGTSDTVAMLSSDQLDIGGVAINAGAFNVVARGVSIRLVADRGSTIPGRATPSLAVRTDILERKPWSGYQDLRGMKVAGQQANSISEYWLEQALRRGGLRFEDVEYITPMPYPDMAVAFANKALDAAQYNEPWATMQEQQGIVKKVAYADDVDPNGHVAAYVYSETFARNTPAARAFLVGWLRGVRDYWDAYDGRKDFQLVVDVLQKYTTLKDETLIRKIPPTGQNPAGYLDLATLARYQDWFAERGLVPQKADISKAYDPSFAEYANAVLGPYEPVANPRRPE